MTILNLRGNLLPTLMNFPTVITFFLGLQNAMVIVIQLISYHFSYVVSTQISGVKMGRPKKSDHPRHKYPHKHSFGGRGTVLTKGSIQRKRPTQALCQLASTNLGVKSTASLPGTLTPYLDKVRGDAPWKRKSGVCSTTPWEQPTPIGQLFGRKKLC